jgi:protein TonB
VNTLSPMVDHQRFFAMLGAAFLIHLMGLLVWGAFFGWSVEDILVRPLHIRLGGGVTLDSNAAPSYTPELGELPPQPVMKPSKAERTETLNSLSDMQPKQRKEMRRTQPSPTAKAERAPEPESRRFEHKRYVRASEAGGGSAGVAEIWGDAKATDTVVVTRYTQAISAWIHQQGNAAASDASGTVIIRIRIDRTGRILQSNLEQPSASDALNQEALAMVARANPLPTPPQDYPFGSHGMAEFLIPVRFK